MKQLTFVPSLKLQQTSVIPSNQDINTLAPEKNIKNQEVFSEALSRKELQEKSPMGIETGMVYIAVPASILAWVGIIYLIMLMFP